MTLEETIDKVYEKFDAPWDIIELEARSKWLRESGRYYSVVTASGRRIAGCVTFEEATLIAIAPEMYAGHGLNIDTEAIRKKIKRR